MNYGKIEVICGSMFSGKTEELMRRLRRAEIARKKIRVFKPEIDNRYEHKYIVSHNHIKYPAFLVEDIKDLLGLVNNVDVVAIDEAQFFGEEIVDVCDTLAYKGYRVIVAGLDQDYLGKPFGYIPQLMAIAEKVSKVHAICIKCGGSASKSKRVTESKELIKLGHSDIYEARCRGCFNVE